MKLLLEPFTEMVSDAFVFYFAFCQCKETEGKIATFEGKTAVMLLLDYDKEERI